MDVMRVLHRHWPMDCDYAVVGVLAVIPEMKTPPFDDCPPESDVVTPYDERHLVTYLRLLDAAAEVADWREVVRVVFELDPDLDPDRARSVHDTHLARAEWMTEKGFRCLLRASRN
jgi:hypothetical protein